MIDSIVIRNFRLFEYLKIEHLAQVNLFVGKNNSGKSALLEALHVFASGAMPEVLMEIVTSRQELWTAGAQQSLFTKFPISMGFSGNPLRHLFHGHQFPDIDSEGIVISQSDVGDNEVRITTAAYRRENQEEGSLNIVRVTSEEVSEDMFEVELYLVVEENGRTRRLFNLLDDLNRRHRMFAREHLRREINYPLQVVPAGNMSNRQIAALWDITSLTDFEREVIAGLQLIEPRIKAVAFVEDVGRRGPDNRIPLVKLEGVNEPLPLKSMGDGMTRLFHIVVGLVNSKDGLLLIDEFENGLHWSVQSRIWDIIFRLSSSLNVQVFASTHSRDCIRGFDSTWTKHEYQGAFYRLDTNPEGQVKAVAYDSETLSDALETDVEVR